MWQSEWVQNWSRRRGMIIWHLNPIKEKAHVGCHGREGRMRAVLLSRLSSGRLLSRIRQLSAAHNASRRLSVEIWHPIISCTCVWYWLFLVPSQELPNRKKNTSQAWFFFSLKPTKIINSVRLSAKCVIQPIGGAVQKDTSRFRVLASDVLPLYIKCRERDCI